jgi:TBCC domain-containing protein 1
MRGFGDYIRRNLKLLVELSLDKLPANAGAPQAAGSSGSGGATGSSGSGGATAGAEVAYITAQEADRLRFLVQPPRQRQSTPLSSLIAGLSTPGASLPLETVVTILRALWHEETVDSPRLSNLSPMQHAAALGSSPSPRAQRQLGLVGPSGHVDDSSVTGLHKGTVVRGEGDVPGGVLRITDCHEAIVYALAPLQVGTMIHCQAVAMHSGLQEGVRPGVQCLKICANGCACTCRRCTSQVAQTAWWSLAQQGGLFAWRDATKCRCAWF